MSGQAQLRAAGFPRLASYVGRLPNGLASYPECRAKASVSLGALRSLPDAIPTGVLPPALADHFAAPPRANEWVPETINAGTYLAAADAFFGDDEEAFLQWVYGIGRAMFRSPMYRVLMRVISPERLGKGGEKRWSAFHLGTTYTVEVLDDGTSATIGFPPHLFPPLFVRGTLQAVLAAYHASGAPDATAELTDLTSETARTRVHWNLPA